MGVLLVWLVRWLFPTDFALLIKSICVPRNLWENFLAEGSVCSAKSVGEFFSRRFCVFRVFCGRISQQKVLCIPRILWENISAEGSVCSANSVGDYLSGCVGMAGCHTLLC